MHNSISPSASCDHRRRVPGSLQLSFAAACLLVIPVAARAQLQAETALVATPAFSTSVDATPVAADAALPEAPSALAFPAPGQNAPAALTQPVASRFATVILPGQTAPRLTVTDKFLSGVVSTVSPAAIVGWVLSAGYSTVTDGSPNYGRSGKGFAQSLGASAARASSETIFGNAVLAPIMHQDSRYYKMGPGHNFIKRTVYAVTRPLITRTDGGHATLNVWDIGGDLAGSALTPVYYPPLNTSFTQVMQTWGGSIGGDALGFFATEFFGNLFQIGGSHKAN